MQNNAGKSNIARPLFSIVVPIYNVGSYLNKCVDSVLAQRFNGFEVILVDDGSTDSCREICDSYVEKDKRIRVIHKENGGLVSARKTGANIAHGEYIVCLDGDDWMSADFLVEAKALIDAYNDIDVICFGYYLFDNVERTTHSIDICGDGLFTKDSIVTNLYPRLIMNSMGEYFPSSIWGKVYKKDIYLNAQNNVPDAMSICEDAICVIQCIFNSSKVFISSKPEYFYRVNNTSMTRTKKSYDVMYPELFYSSIVSNIDCIAYDFQEQLYRRVVHELFILSISQFRCMDKKQAIHNMENLINAVPIYRKAIERANFSIGTKTVKDILLQHKLWNLIYIMGKLCHWC